MRGLTSEKLTKYTPQELFDKNKHLAGVTLFRLLRRPHDVAKSYSLDYEDLLQYAYEGLWKACVTYNPELSSFYTYAISCIRWSTLDGLNREAKLFKYDVNNMPQKEDKYKLVGLDGADDKKEVMSDSISLDRNNSTTENEALNRVLTQSLISNLSEREKEIIKLRAQDVTEKDIAKKFGVTQQAINKTIQRIRKRLSQKERGNFNDSSR